MKCLYEDERLMPFMRFLRALNPDEYLRRVTFLKKLSLDFYHPAESVAPILELLFEIIARAASNFTSLKIFEAEALLAAHPPLCAAIAKLTTLKALNLSDAGVQCATLLCDLQSSLVLADISFSVDDRGPEDEVVHYFNTNPILLLQDSQSTLESLDTTFAVSSPYGPCYANVTSLSLSCINLPVIEDYIRAFPNLLSLATCECGGFLEDPGEERRRRETSMDHQAQHGTWRSLRHYSGSVLELWTSGLTCQIPSIQLGFAQRGVDAHMLNDVLRDVRPSALALTLALTLPGASCLLDDGMGYVLSREGRLRELDLRVLLHLNGTDESVSVGGILNLLVYLVRLSSVPTFRLKLDLSWMNVVRGRAESGADDEAPPIMPFEVYLQDMDVDAYADTLFAKVASLKEVRVSVLGGLTLEELRSGPTDLASEHASSPALEYPDVPPQPVFEDGTPNELKLCYVLGWLEDDVSTQMEVAGYQARLHGERTYEETFARALRNMRQTSNYFHVWTTYGFVLGGEDPGASD
ncbi:hypothetical protein V8D89_007670 [Ganoderma adspersum]